MAEEYKFKKVTASLLLLPHGYCRLHTSARLLVDSVEVGLWVLQKKIAAFPYANMSPCFPHSGYHHCLWVCFSVYIKRKLLNHLFETLKQLNLDILVTMPKHHKVSLGCQMISCCARETKKEQNIAFISVYS